MCENGRCCHNLFKSLPDRRLWDNLTAASFMILGHIELRSMDFLSLCTPQLTSFELHLPSIRTAAYDRDWPTTATSFKIPPTLLRSLTSFSFRCNWEATPIIPITLQHCVNVTTLTLNVNSDEGRMQWADSDPFIKSLSRNGLLLPKLQRLRIRQCEPSDAAKLFNLLNAPNIHDIDISFEGYETDLEHQDYENDDPCWIPKKKPYFNCPRIHYGDVGYYEVEESFGEALGVFMGRSGSSLRSLRLHYATITGAALSTMLLHLNPLTHLVLDEFNLDSDCFKDAHVSSVLPNLQMLELLNLPTEYTLERVEEFVRGDEEDKGLTLRMTHIDPDVCCPTHSQRMPPEAADIAPVALRRIAVINMF
ncbi:hypothetical protein MD484_g6577, partial [Candolleomyces efflorescens]